MGAGAEQGSRGAGEGVENDFRPYSQRFCDVAFTVKFYCKCDVAKSL